MIKIVKAEENHIKDICQLWLEFMNFTREIVPVFALREGALPVFEREYLRPAMAAENSLVLVALDGERVVGYSYSLFVEPAKIEKREKQGYIHDMFVTADYRRRGIGKKMYDEILKWFRSEAINRVELEVLPENKVAGSFWGKHGYTEFKRTLYREI